MEKSFSAWRQFNKEKGFFLIELVFSLCFMAMLAALIVRSLGQIVFSWTNLSNQTSLFDVGHYMLGTLEKNLAYESALITISKDGSNNAKLTCQTIQGNLVYIFTYEHKHIYKTIRKANGSGKNPLYVSACEVINWQVIQLSEQELLVEITLQQGNKQSKVSRIFYCLNGRIETDAA